MIIILKSIDMFLTYIILLFAVTWNIDFDQALEHNVSIWQTLLGFEPSVADILLEYLIVYMWYRCTHFSVQCFFDGVTLCFMFELKTDYDFIVQCILCVFFFLFSLNMKTCLNCYWFWKNAFLSFFIKKAVIITPPTPINEDLTFMLLIL